MTTTRGLNRVLYAIAGAGPLAFLILATVEGFVRDGYDPIAQPISALAIGPRGWVQELNFMLLAASFLAFAAVLHLAFRRGVAALSAPAVLAMMTVGVVIAGAFVMDAPGAPLTRAGRLHEAAGFLVFPWLPVVTFLVARRFRRDVGWRRHFKYTIATGLVCFASLVFFLVFVGPPSTPHALADLRGLVQRIVLVPFFTWIALVTRTAYVALDKSAQRPAGQHSISTARPQRVSMGPPTM